ncbi:MAG: homoserine dehydrogenase, partial [Candidatus Electrothrix sp. ATG1]|nr:homoserine dehydrogenase [Candidatus Electrothrix sp. ATG1]
MKHVNVGLIGFGTVGSGLAEVLLSQQERLQQRSGLFIRLAKVADIAISELPA